MPLPASFRRGLAALSGVAVLAGCAATPVDLRFMPKGLEGDRKLVWPAPPEVPRFRYSGELTGEANFVRNDVQVANGFNRFVGWLTGLVAGEAAPVVMQRPQAGVVDEEGRIYVTDISRKAVFVFDEKRGQMLVWEMASETTRFKAPIGIALGARGEILVSDAELHIVARLNRDGVPVGHIDGTGVLQRPTGLARDPEQGLLYVADTRAHDIKVFDDAGDLVNIIGHSGDLDGELNAPTHLAFAGGELYVTDSMNSRIQVYSGTGEMIRRFGDRGLYVGNLVRPKGVAVDNEGHIYVVESYFGYLLVYDSDGQLLMSIGGSGMEHGQFYLPSGIWIDRRNRVFVADMFNGRVEIFQFLGES